MTAPTTNLFDPPYIFTLPVSLGMDIIVTFINNVPGSNPPVPADYPEGVTVTLVIGKAGVVSAEGEATITGSNAVCRIPFAQADTLKTGQPWRCVVAVPDPDGIHIDNIVPINGGVERYDGV
jgi:hypothetical protein